MSNPKPESTAAQVQPLVRRLQNRWSFQREATAEAVLALAQDADTRTDHAHTQITELGRLVETTQQAFQALSARAEATDVRLRESLGREAVLQSSNEAQADKLVQLGMRVSGLETRLDDEQRRNAEMQGRHDVIARVLSAPPSDDKAVRAFRDLLQNQLPPLLARLRAADTATALLRLQAVGDQLEVLSDSPVFLDKNLVAVAGGFSSGKSSFITSLMTDKHLGLPTGIEPMTAIPTYVVPGPRSTVRGHTRDGGVVDIDPEMYRRLSHAFVSGFGFNLKRILPFVAVETPLRDLAQLAFVDLPGYDAAHSDRAYTEEDFATALEIASQAQALIWVVPLDAGTLPQSDIEFLSSLGANEQPLYVVASKADQKPPSQIGAILDQMASALRGGGIDFCGLCAYDAQNGEALDHREKPLSEVLAELDRPSPWRERLHEAVNEAFADLAKAMQEVADQRRKTLSTLNSLELDLFEGERQEDRRSSDDASPVGADDEGTLQFSTRLTELRTQLPDIDAGPVLLELERLRERFRNVLDHLPKSS